MLWAGIIIFGLVGGAVALGTWVNMQKRRGPGGATDDGYVTAFDNNTSGPSETSSGGGGDSGSSGGGDSGGSGSSSD